MPYQARLQRVRGCAIGAELSDTTMRIETLKRPAEFKRVRGGARWAGPLFIIEARRRPSGMTTGAAGVIEGARFGFTITKKIGNAVIRNRTRRRLKEALRSLGATMVRSDFDYVVVASREAHDYPFAGLQSALREALERLHRQADGKEHRVAPGRSTAKMKRETALPSSPVRPKGSRALRSSDAVQFPSEADESNSGDGSGRR